MEVDMNKRNTLGRIAARTMPCAAMLCLGALAASPGLAIAAGSPQRKSYHIDVLNKEATISTRGPAGAPGSSITFAGVLSGTLGNGASVSTITFGQGLK